MNTEPIHTHTYLKIKIKNYTLYIVAKWTSIQAQEIKNYFNIFININITKFKKKILNETTTFRNAFKNFTQTKTM